LLFAHHRGLASLGWVMVLGSLTGMLSCLLVLPAALKLFRYGQSLDKES
jgi:predicted RND superfamily exporter protein